MAVAQTILAALRGEQQGIVIAILTAVMTAGLLTCSLAAPLPAQAAAMAAAVVVLGLEPYLSRSFFHDFSPNTVEYQFSGNFRGVLHTAQHTRQSISY